MTLYSTLDEISKEYELARSLGLNEEEAMKYAQAAISI